MHYRDEKYAMLNKRLLSLFRKMESDEYDLISSGNLFHDEEPAIAKASLVNFVLIFIVQSS